MPIGLGSPPPFGSPAFIPSFGEGLSPPSLGMPPIGLGFGSPMPPIGEPMPPFGLSSALFCGVSGLASGFASPGFISGFGSAFGSSLAPPLGLPLAFLSKDLATLSVCLARSPCLLAISYAVFCLKKKITKLCVVLLPPALSDDGYGVSDSALTFAGGE